MEPALFDDDLSEPGLISPEHLHRGRSVPSTAVVCFFNDLLGDLVFQGVLRQIYTLRSEIGTNPVYEFRTSGESLTVVHPGVGAPLAAGVVEELRGLGVRTIVACGGAGALRSDLDLGRVMVVESALRDEGTSFHYAAPSRVIHADETCRTVVEEVLRERGVEFLTGRTWTTDGFFRETKSRIARRVDEGCLMVDMESAALIAVTRFHGLRFAQLLYAGDLLSGEEWDSRRWDRAMHHRRALFDLSIHAALRLAELPSHDSP
jgi:uridine phosphorylase